MILRRWEAEALEEYDGDSSELSDPSMGAPYQGPGLQVCVENVAKRRRVE